MFCPECGKKLKGMPNSVCTAAHPLSTATTKLKKWRSQGRKRRPLSSAWRRKKNQNPQRKNLKEVSFPARSEEEPEEEEY